MKIAFVWYFREASKILPNWRDGLRGALELIEKEHQVDWFLDEDVPPVDNDYDWILFWGDSEGPFFADIDKYKCKKGLFLSTMPQNINNLRKLDMIWCESQPVLETVQSYNLPCLLGFGTDTDFFSPDPARYNCNQCERLMGGVEKDIEFFYPATFSLWKKQSEIAYLGDKLLCVGTLQPDGYFELEACEKTGVQLVIGYIPVIEIRDYYRRAKNVIIPAAHGSERTVLEAMSMDIVPIVNQGNAKSKSYVDEYKKSGYKSSREFVLKNYSHKIYAEQILKGLEL